MSKTSEKRLNPAARTLGAKTFAAISAVEGLKLSPGSKARLDTLKSSGHPADEWRAEIRRVYSGDPRKG